jgi:hypothetical protein
MAWRYVAIGAFVALFPFAAFALIGLEVVMVYQIAKKYDAVVVDDLIRFCGIMITVSLFLKFLALWLHLIPIVGQVANSVVAGGFIYFVHDVATTHYSKIGKARI